MTQDISAREIRKFNGGEVILGEGEHNDCFFVILTGVVDISQCSRAIRTLRDGDVFGLEARLLNRPSSVQARAASKSRVAAYSHEVLAEILYSRPQMVERLLVSLLEQLEQTTQVAQENSQRQSASSVNMRFLEDGEVLFREGDPGGEVYKLVSTEGGLKLSSNGKQLAMITRPNQIFGEMSGILNQRHSKTATSAGRSVVQIYPRKHLEELIEENPAFAHQLIEHLAAKLARAGGGKGQATRRNS